MNTHRFSERIGKIPIRTALQIASIDKKLENRLWNAVVKDFFAQLSYSASRYETSEGEDICMKIWEEFYGNRVDEIPRSAYGGGVACDDVIAYVKKWFFKCEWFEKYDFIEFVCMLSDNRFHKQFDEICNRSLKGEMSGYRVVNHKIVQVTSEEEIAEIELATDNSSSWTSVQSHIETAIKLFSDRENPDYRNSIKESISAVEALCVIATGDSKATLGKALTLVEEKYKLHGALKSAFSSLYGYVSDSGGIRHSLLEDDVEVTQEDAKFMLVSCSAFINYLKVKIDGIA